MVAQGAEISLVADITRAQRARRPEEVAMVFEERKTTFAELDDRASQVANGLLGEGVRPQARIALLDKSSDSFFEIMFGVAKANGVMVAVNWRLAPAEIAYIINDSAAEILFVGEEYLATIENIGSDLKKIRKVISLGGSRPEWEPYSEWRDRQSTEDPRVAVDPDDVVLQMYTSGTTGCPKGAQLTNRNLLTLLPTAIREWGDWNHQDVSLITMPLFHIGGSGYACLSFFVGARSVIMREVSCPEILRLIPRQRVTKTFVVPAVLLFLLQTPGVEETDFSSLKLIMYGAAPMPLELLRQAIKTFKCDFAQVYGLTETTGAITYMPPADHDAAGSPRLRSCGKPLSAVDLRIVDSAGRQAPAGEVGEIICRSAQVMKGYWNMPEETARVIRGDWFYTGDAGYMDEDGYLYIHDRIKDMIVSGGENIYPAEVESVIFGHPDIADVAVIGIPDDRWGESVKAVVVRKPGAEVTAEQLIEFTRERIARYKAPRSVDFVDALPRNPSGKLLKRLLRAPYWEGRERQVN